SLSLILGPVLGGWLFEAAPQAVFAVSAGLMVLVLVLSIGMQRLPALTTSENMQGEPVPIHH
ncbi:MAG: hypothetical protein J2P36_09675, partial [Ktedonobacteraceae bacterium]|nr:hypothetical protein [Ktedonobacteraceae bacterium]